MQVVTCIGAATDSARRSWFCSLAPRNRKAEINMPNQEIAELNGFKEGPENA
jgi:hypothetical protein